MIFLRQSTASQEVAFGIFVDDTDGKTAETALSIANTDIKIHKAGATTLANKNSGGLTHISQGIYYGVFDATDTDTLGSGAAYVHMTGALPVKVEFCVLLANVYDSLVGGLEFLLVGPYKQEFSISGGTLTALKLDGTTTQYTATVTSNAAADPIVGIS